MTPTEEQVWDGVVINVQPGDIITSKKGIIFETMLTGRLMLERRLKYLGNGKWKSRGRRVEIEATKVQA